jgi:hypothetical protein
MDVKKAGERIPVPLVEERLESPEFQELWDRIQHRTEYRVEVDEASLRAAMIKALRSMLPVPKRRGEWVTHRVERIEHRRPRQPHCVRVVLPPVSDAVHDDHQNGALHPRKVGRLRELPGAHRPVLARTSAPSRRAWPLCCARLTKGRGGARKARRQEQFRGYTVPK